jgi:hypothetical protein
MTNMRADPQFAGLLNKLEANSLKAMILPTRPPVTANKARGTGSSAIYNPATGKI